MASFLHAMDTGAIMNKTRVLLHDFEVREKRQEYGVVENVAKSRADSGRDCSSLQTAVSDSSRLSLSLQGAFAMIYRIDHYLSRLFETHSFSLLCTFCGKYIDLAKRRWSDSCRFPILIQCIWWRCTVLEKMCRVSHPTFLTFNCSNSLSRVDMSVST